MYQPMKAYIAIGCILAVGVIAAQSLTIFVVQPIGAVPDGVTVIMTRLNTMQFIDSADAWCERELDTVSLLCRATVMGRVADQAHILVRLPYFETLYRISTNGKIYDR
jgi:hypothetical protein